MVGMGEGQTKAKASKKGEGGSAGSPLPVVCWLQEEGSFLGLSVLLSRLPHPQVPAPCRVRIPGQVASPLRHSVLLCGMMSPLRVVFGRNLGKNP